MRNRFKEKKWIVILASFCAILWGSAFPVLKIGYIEMNIQTDDVYHKILIAGIRFFIAGLLILIYAYFALDKKIKLKTKNDFFKVSLLGFFQTALNYFFFYIGVANVAASKASIINSLSNFLVIIIAHFIYKSDKLNKSKIIGIIFGFLGVLIVNLGSGIDSTFTFTGEGFMFISVLTAVASSFMVKEFSRTVHPALLSAYQLLIGSSMMLIVATRGNYQNLRVTPLGIGLLLYSAALSAVAFTLWTTLMKYNNPGEITMFKFLIPVSGSILAFIFLGEPITIKTIISLIFIVIGIILVNKNLGEYQVIEEDGKKESI